MSSQSCYDLNNYDNKERDEQKQNQPNKKTIYE